MDSRAFRHEAVWLAMLLLENWPDRFIETMRSANIKSAFLNLDRPSLPYWLDAVIKMEFNERRCLGEDEVSRALEYVRQTGRNVSRIGVKRVLGVTESKTIDATISIKRDRFTLAETRMFFR